MISWDVSAKRLKYKPIKSKRNSETCQSGSSIYQTSGIINIPCTQMFAHLKEYNAQACCEFCLNNPRCIYWSFLDKVNCNIGFYDPDCKKNVLSLKDGENGGNINRT
ncbi:14169_t:CDS:1 [Cetraspora pellucida]|uniref:14169_t:CDS:1 n=1 Tax=Cetraspora pellucida TaxID=1433469 RepID=A0A9N9ITQ1_9GLOM|nr:14169_t:CDS:1 [Cetraspora pellucida]